MKTLTQKQYDDLQEQLAKKLADVDVLTDDGNSSIDHDTAESAAFYAMQFMVDKELIKVKK